MKLKTKEKIGSRYRRKYEAPRTAYQRLLESPHVSKEAKLRLRHTFRQLNPFTLKKEIERKLKKIFTLHRQLQARSEGSACRDDAPKKDRKMPAFKVREGARNQGLAP